MKRRFLPMKLKLSLLILAFLLPACGRRSDHDIIRDVHEDYDLLSSRYAEVLDALDQGYAEDITEAVRLVGIDYQLSFGQSLWASLLGNSHLAYSEGSPLHRALYFVEKDAIALGKHAQRLGRCVLFNTLHIATKIEQLRYALGEAMRIVQAQKAYTQEAQFIESRRVQQAQLAQARNQTELLRDMADNRQPVPQKVTIKTRKVVIH